MKNLLLLALLITATVSFAEKLIFTNNGDEVEITGDAQIDFATGDISVTTVGDHSIIDNQNTPVILGFYPSDYDITAGSNITVYWSVAFASTCNATVLSGNAGWSGSKNATNGSHSQANVNVSVLPAQLQLDCRNAGGAATVATINLSEQTGGGGGNDPEISFLRVNSQSGSVIVNPPGTASITWDTANVASCTASANPAVAGWSGNVGTSGQQNVTITENTDISLSCGALNASVDVIYSENSSCTSAVYPNGLTRLLAIYRNVNDGFNFGESTSSTFEVEIANDQFVSLTEFSMPTPNTRRRVVFENAPTNYNLMGQGTLSVSECPGDFTNTAVCVREISNSSTLFFSNRPSDVGSPLNFCVLDPSVTYYINFVTSPDPYNEAPDCADTNDDICAVFYSESFMN